MNKETDNLGKVFRDTLKNHRIETNANLWGRLDSQLSMPSNIVSPKVSLLKSLPILKVAAAVSLIVSVALAYNFIYLPLVKSHAVDKTNIISKDKPVIDNVIPNIDSSANTTNNDIAEINNPKTDLSIHTDNNENKPADNNQFVPVSNTLNNLNNYQNNTVVQNQPDKIVQLNNSPVTKTDSSHKATVVNSNNENQSFNQNQPTENPVQNPGNDVIDLQIPNYFTPNNDGFNDYFVIKNIETCNTNQLIILNRSGVTVYDKLNYQNNWDASNLQNGVYFYVFKFKFKNKDFEKMGTVTVDR